MKTGEGENWLQLSLVKMGQTLDQRKKQVITWMISSLCHCAGYLLFCHVMQHCSAVTDVSAQLSVLTSTVKQSKLGRLI